MRSTRLLATALALVCLGAAYADYVVVPNAYANQMGTNGLNSPLRDYARTFVEILGADQLGSVQVGNQITGVTFRLYSGSSAWPPSAATWQNYDIYMGNAAVNPGGLSTSIAANYVAGTRTQVRAGSMTIPAGAFQQGSPVAPWSTFEFTFATPYTYTGGGLILEISHTGNNIASNAFCDHPTEWGTGNHSGYATTYNATTLAYMYTAPLTTRVTYIPEPAALALLALGALIRRR